MTDHDDKDGNFLNNRFLDLESEFAIGYKPALYDVLKRSNQGGLGLPDWATAELQKLVVEKWKLHLNTWKGTSPSFKVGYKKLLGKYLRATIYGSARLWMKNKNHYRRMPTKCIEAWYEGKLENLPNGADGAIELTQIGLIGTFAANTSKSTIEKERYLNAVPEANKMDFSNPEMAAAYEMGDDEYQDYQRELYRESKQLHLSFGYSDTEVIFGLREPGRFWGPPYDPPEHIQRTLEEEKPLWNKSDELDWL